MPRNASSSTKTLKRGRTHAGSKQFGSGHHSAQSSADIASSADSAATATNARRGAIEIRMRFTSPRNRIRRALKHATGTVANPLRRSANCVPIADYENTRARLESASKARLHSLKCCESCRKLDDCRELTPEGVSVYTRASRTQV